MALQSKLWSLNALASETGHNIRTIARALNHVPPDGRAGKHPAWTLKTALAALGRREAARTGNVGEECVRLAEELEAGLARMAGERDITKRREIGREVGPLVGALDVALEAAAADTAPDHRLFHQFFRDAVVGRAVGQFLSLMQMEIIAAG